MIVDTKKKWNTTKITLLWKKKEFLVLIESIVIGLWKLPWMITAKKNLSLVELIERGFQYKLCLETNSVFSIDSTTEFIVDRLQYHCPLD